MVHVALQYAAHVKNLIVESLRLIFSGKIMIGPLCTENNVEHMQSYIRIPVWPEIRDS